MGNVFHDAYDRSGFRQFHERRFYAVRYLAFTIVLPDDFCIASVFRRSVDLVVA